MLQYIFLKFQISELVKRNICQNYVNFISIKVQGKEIVTKEITVKTAEYILFLVYVLPKWAPEYIPNKLQQNILFLKHFHKL